jgi:hypothetical protein
MAYYVCPTCGAPLALADPPTRGRKRPRYDAPQIATCADCGLLERGPLTEKRARRVRDNLIGAPLLCLFFALFGAWWLSRDEDALAISTLAPQAWIAAMAVVCVVVLVVTLVRIRNVARLMVAWQPYRREGDAPQRSGNARPAA